jgi:hypothetical protein
LTPLHAECVLLSGDRKESALKKALRYARAAAYAAAPAVMAFGFFIVMGKRW